VTAVLKGLNFQNVVDVGCGTGEWLEHFRETGARVAGLDACEAMLQQARSRTGLSGRLVLGDAHLLPFRDSWADLIICSMSLGYFENPHSIFREFARVTRRGGFLVVSDLHPDAIASGWTRSFKSDGTLYEIEHFRHSIQQVTDSGFQAGLILRQRIEPQLGQAELPIFREAGKFDSFRAATMPRALFIALWEKL